MILLVDFHERFWLLLPKRAHVNGSSAKKEHINRGLWGGGGEGGAAASVPTAPENLLLFASFISQFTASMLGFKVHLAPPMVKHNGRANSKIGYSVFIFVYFKA